MKTDRIEEFEINAYDLKENIYALWVAAATGVNQEQAFAYVRGEQDKLFLPEGNRKEYARIARMDITEDDVVDMVRMKEQGLTVREIAQMYCLHFGTVSKLMKRYRNG